MSAFDENPDASLRSNSEAAEIMGQSVCSRVEFTVSQPLVIKVNGDSIRRRRSLPLEPFLNSLVITKRHKKPQQFILYTLCFFVGKRSLTQSASEICSSK